MCVCVCVCMWCVCGEYVFGAYVCVCDVWCVVLCVCVGHLCTTYECYGIGHSFLYVHFSCIDIAKYNDRCVY